jgi:hypothetical protein
MFRVSAVLVYVLASCSVGAAGTSAAAPESSRAEQPAKPAASMFSTEVWLTPLILLPGVALLIVSTSARFGQLHTEFHRLVDRPNARGRIVGRHLLKRSVIFRNALVALYGSVGLFALGSLLGGVVNLWRPESLWVVGGLTIVGIGCIVYASVLLLWEALICLQALQEHYERLEDFDREG